MTSNFPRELASVRHRARSPRTFAFSIALSVVVACAGCASHNDDNTQAASVTPTNVTLTAAQRQNIKLYTVQASRFHRTVETTGVVDYNNEQATSVLAPISGPVSRLLVAPGDKVKKGDALAMVDSPDYAAAIGAYRKALVTARTLRKLADLDKDLVQHQGVAQREADQAESDAASAEADVYSAQQTLVSLNIDPQTIKAVEQGKPIARIQGVIRSPLSGTVVERLITPGLLLQAGTTPCFTIADLSHMWVMAQVPDTDLGSVHVGDTAEVVTGASTAPLAGTVENVAALVSPDTRLVPARVVIKNPQGVLKKQMYVTVRIRSSNETEGMLVPVSAILRDDENLPFVYVAQHDGTFARRGVTQGDRVGDQFNIPSGLQAGDEIVVDGGIFVQFMQNQ